MTRHNVVLAYHAIGTCPRSHDPDSLFVEPGTFAAQMEYISRTGRVRPLDEVVATSRGGYIAVTFDDAYRSVLVHAAPILRRLGLPATVFVPTAHLGTTNSWVAPGPCDLEIMDENELGAAKDAGLDLQSHGHGHIDYSAASKDEARADASASIEILERVTGERPRYLAYPWGRYNSASAVGVAEAGIDVAFSIYVPGDDALRESVPSRLGHDRVPVTSYDGTAVFRAKVTGRYLGIRRSRAVGVAYALIRPLVRRLLERGGSA